MEKEEPASPHALAADIAAKVLKKAPKIKLPKLRGRSPWWQNAATKLGFEKEEIAGGKFCYFIKV